MTCTSKRRDHDAPARALEQWFAVHQRDLPWRRSYDPYQVWVSEVMLQQTRMEVVVPYFTNFVARFPTVAALAAAAEDEVLAAWSGLGYYRRARFLHAGARFVVSEYGGRLPESADELVRIPGIGRYTAGAIASIAFDQPAAIVDGNVARVFARLFAIEHPLRGTPLLAASWAYADEIVRAAGSPRALNQALMELGALVCTPARPDCASCPVAVHCEAHRRGDVSRYPLAAPRATAIDVEIPLYVVRDSKSRILLERHYGARMSGMFHLPHGSSALLADSSGRFVAQGELGSFRHTITHRRIVFRLVEAEPVARVADSPHEQIWVDHAALKSVAHPSYVRKAFALLSRRKALQPPRRNFE